MTAETFAPGRVLFTLYADVELDGRFVDPREPVPWHGFDRMLEALPGLRGRLEDASGSPVHFDWFVRADAQVATVYGDAGWALARYADAFGRLAEAGDGVGLHVHPYRWLADAGDWITDFGNPGWIEECCGVAFAAYSRELGRPCRTFRFGDGWMDARTMKALEALGTHFEATVEPGRAGRRTFHGGHPHTGRIHSWQGAPAHPYFPAADNAGRAGRRRDIIEVPVSTVRMRGPRGLQGRARRLLRRLPAGAVTPFLAGPPGRFQSAVDRLVRDGGAMPYLRIPFRTSGYVNELRPNLDANLEWLFARPWLARCSFVALSEAVDRDTAAVRLGRTPAAIA